MFRTRARFYKNLNKSDYTLNYNLFNSLNRLFTYTVRKYPVLNRVFLKNIGKWPKYKYKRPDEFRISEAPDDCVELTYLGHRTMFIQMEGVRFLTDPVLSKRLFSAGLGVKRTSGNWYRYWHFPAADFLLISNNSYDCMDTWTLRKISDQGGALAIGGMNITKYMNMFYERFTYPLRWFEEVDFGCVKITFLPAKSETKRKYLSCGIDRNRVLWGGFLIRSDHSTIFYAGKTDFSDHFEKIKEYLTDLKCKIDIAILPIGPEFKHKINMSPEEAVNVHLTLKPKHTIVVAHDTFPLGIEAFGELKSRLTKHIESINKEILNEFLILQEKESFRFSPLM
ncbi:uncharacterized protein TA19325 [Theileria annulata]|uniref:Metallo-beta-lactamase domain-containing protein n=1 Tax=Theileria annulata TaxID=5874 RepID=Q4UGD8_THEAN|nr:uncharacterized protein TA19325 [Theileria annulata]CAI73851.1 hypothetical protein, conserved [Theileria annulata]|eukprot:XP_954528.1 hypothetical protein, conserved [Theileria annulata]